MTTKKSTEITNLDASPVVKLTHHNLDGILRIATGTVALLTTDIDDDDIIILARLKTNVSVVSIKIFNDALDAGSALDYDCGIYTTAGVVVDRDAYASSVNSLVTANLVGQEVVNEARNITGMGQFLWEDAGQSTDPGGHYDIALTIETVAATAAAGDLGWQILYVMQ